MARARNIKPRFFRDDELVEASPWARLLFIGLWTLADRRGVAEDRPKWIKMELFPGDDVDVDALLSELEGVGKIQRYEAGGKRGIWIPGFVKHQNPHHREADNDLPLPDGVEPQASPGQAQGQTSASRAESPTPESLNPEDSPPRGGEAPAGPPPCPQKEIIELYHEMLPMCPPVRDWHETRQGMLRARWRAKAKHQSMDFWRDFFAYVAESPFLTGQAEAKGDRPPFVADLEWLVKPTNFAKVIEGKYHNG